MTTVHYYLRWISASAHLKMFGNQLLYIVSKECSKNSVKYFVAFYLLYDSIFLTCSLSLPFGFPVSFLISFLLYLYIDPMQISFL